MARAALPEPVKMTLSEEEHIVREWDKLNKEIEKLLDETRSREKYSITIIAGVATWVLTNKNCEYTAAYKIVSFIPIITTFLFGLSVLFLYLNILWISKYLTKIENYFLYKHPNKFGWENHFMSENKWHNFVVITIVMWFVQLYFAFAFCGYVHDWKCCLIPG